MNEPRSRILDKRYPFRVSEGINKMKAVFGEINLTQIIRICEELQPVTKPLSRIQKRKGTLMSEWIDENWKTIERCMHNFILISISEPCPVGYCVISNSFSKTNQTVVCISASFRESINRQSTVKAVKKYTIKVDPHQVLTGIDWLLNKN